MGRPDDDDDAGEDDSGEGDEDDGIDRLGAVVDVDEGPDVAVSGMMRW